MLLSARFLRLLLNRPSKAERVHINGPAQHGFVARAQGVQGGLPARQQPLQGGAAGAFQHIWTRSMPARRCMAAGTAG